MPFFGSRLFNLQQILVCCVTAVQGPTGLWPCIGWPCPWFGVYARLYLLDNCDALITYDSPFCINHISTIFAALQLHCILLSG